MADNEFIFSTPFQVEQKSGEVHLRGFITTGDKDLVNDIVTRNCFKSIAKQINEGNIKLDLEHEAFRGSNDIEKEINKTKMPIGRFLKAEDSDDGVIVDTVLNEFHGKFREVKGAVEKKFYDAFSIAYIPTKVAYKSGANGEKIRMLDDVKLLNTALTGNAVNTKAQITEIFMKSMDAFEKRNNPMQELKEVQTVSPESKLEVKSSDETSKGIAKESKEHPEMSPETIKQLVADHLKENPNYYSQEQKSYSSVNDDHLKIERRLNTMSTDKTSTSPAVKAEMTKEEEEEAKKKKAEAEAKAAEEESAKKKKEDEDKEEKSQLKSLQTELADVKTEMKSLAERLLAVQNKAISSAIVEQKDHSQNVAGNSSIKSTMDIVRHTYGRY